MYLNEADGEFAKMMSRYEMLSTYTTQVKQMNRELVGRDNEVRSIMASFERPELSNVILLASAGSGKTAIVQGCAKLDEHRIYLEVDLSKMIAELPNVDEMGNRLKEMFAEAGDFTKREPYGIVLFMDEFHQIVQLSPAAVEALKPLLADSATRNIRVIAATTYVEFRKYISSNQPLVERLHRINLSEPDKEMCVEILKGMAKTYGVADKIIGNSLYEQIYDITQRYIPANAQPRKSILVLDAMVGWHRLEKRKFNKKLLADVIFESEGVNIAFRVDPDKIKSEIDKRVLAQDFATRTVSERLQLCVAGLNDPTRPMSSFLLTGSSGVGKGTTGETLIPVLPTQANGFVHMKKARDIEVGDFVFARDGHPEPVVGVFPQGFKDVYRVTLTDGRYLDVDGSHLWAVYPNVRSRNEGFTVYSTETLVNKGLRSKGKYSEHCKYVIPMNHAVQWSTVDLPLDPYALGALIGNGTFTSGALSFSSNDDFVTNEVSRRLGAAGYDRSSEANYSYTFLTGEFYGRSKKRVQCSEVIPAALIGCHSHTKFIPDEYKYSSIEQRWELIRGLFDTDGSICQHDGERFNVSYSTMSKQLAEDIQFIMFSLGVGCSVNVHSREGKRDRYDLHVSIANREKWKMFLTPRKREVVERSVNVNKHHERNFDYVGIKSIDKLPEQDETFCLYVGDDEHLYQAGQFVVTHNTELTKVMAQLLFGDGTRSLLRYDMSEYANEDSLDRFRIDLTTRVWEHPYSIIMLDEIEKSCAAVTRLLLQVLDDGRLTDQNGREISFLNAYVVMTTNAGSEIYKTIAQYEASDTGSGEFIARYDKLIRKSLMATTGSRFPPELLGRIDCIVPFQPLSRDTMKKIVVMRLKELYRRLFDSYGVEMSVDKRVIDYLVEDSMDTDSDSGGARAVMAKLQSEVTTQIAAFINSYPYMKRIHVSIEGKLAFENKATRVSDAYVKISGVNS